MNFKHLILALAAAGSFSAQAADSLNLANYAVNGIYSLDALNGTSGGISGLEASAVTYAQDRGSLFFVGDEGTGVIEISKTGQTLGYMNFDWTNTGSTKHDTEGLTYLGGGVLVVGEERLYDAYRFNYTAGGTASLANSSVSISNATVGNNGMEGISYDARNGGSFVTVKQFDPEDVLGGTLSFAAGGGVANMAQLFNPASIGLATLSDVQTLSGVNSLVGTTAADNLLLLSLGSNTLLEVTRSGVIKSSLDLAGIVPHNAIEGVTIDDKGIIYLVAEQEQDGSVLDSLARSRLIVLAAPVPEPETYAMLLAGLGLLGAVARRRKLAA
ncbi:MAG: SdiA-regulated domain-containing protein [Gammaproteobacteria bacterium]|nr:SdiA-regulated domain-containing protein [Gammaproteobacteria bacterium]MBU1600997.1 SdiA-regulated domain-containing protein [Gammaproteobacteria bacterium]MBU2434356.1 SdiA-regulated domain-containing protein [Gammaproteobacteria bacterium]MBU2450760.1 SdiA-regulated domain-containing protein [Gammaproteobacteria bacterium]